MRRIGVVIDKQRFVHLSQLQPSSIRTKALARYPATTTNAIKTSSSMNLILAYCRLKLGKQRFAFSERQPERCARRRFQIRPLDRGNF
jgi:hypothetical protein